MFMLDDIDAWQKNYYHFVPFDFVQCRVPCGHRQSNGQTALHFLYQSRKRIEAHWRLHLDAVLANILHGNRCLGARDV